MQHFLCSGIIVTRHIEDGSITDAKLGDTGWVDPDFGPNVGTGSALPAYRVVGSKIYARGQIARISGNISSGDILFTLPAGRRPSVQQIFLCPGAVSSVTKIVCDPDGIIRTASNPTSSTNYIGLDPLVIKVG